MTNDYLTESDLFDELYDQVDDIVIKFLESRQESKIDIYKLSLRVFAGITVQIILLCSIEKNQTRDDIIEIVNHFHLIMGNLISHAYKKNDMFPNITSDENLVN